MTPLDKAKELIDKSKITLGEFLEEAYLYKWYNKAIKKHALISVDQLILHTFAKSTYESLNLTPIVEFTTEYWLEVKQEIEKL